MAPGAVLYFDVGSPFSYLAVERAAHVLGFEPAFQPVLLGALFAARRSGSWAVGDPGRRAAGMLDVQSRAAAYGLPPVRWPRPWPGDYLAAMRMATWAQLHGAAAAAAAAGLDPDAALRATGDPAIKAALREATEAAFARGVRGVPTLAVGAAMFWGDDRLEEAAATLAPA